MNEEVDFILDSAKENMDRAMAHLEKSFAKIRAGKASPIMLSTVKVDYYGSPTPLSQVANVNTTDARTISVQPWEKNMLQEIEKAITNANLGFNPMNNGDLIIINVPPLTEERRRDLVKQAKAEVSPIEPGIAPINKLPISYRPGAHCEVAFAKEDTTGSVAEAAKASGVAPE